MNVLVCGSRTYGNLDEPNLTDAEKTRRRNQQIRLDNFLFGSYSGWGNITIIEGGAPGADTCARQWVKHNQSIFDNIAHRPFPADWNGLGRKAGPLRNQRMIDEGRPFLVFAFVDKPLKETKGTKDLVARARKAGVHTFVIEDVSEKGSRAT